MRSRARGAAVLGALLAVAVLAPACGSSAEAPAGAQGTTATTAEGADGTTEASGALPPGGRRPTAADPLRVLMAGDSLMADVSLALASTLQDGGRSLARLVEAPSIPRDDRTRTWWRTRLARFDPETIVVLIGVWEGMAIEGLSNVPVGSPAWERAYRDRLVEPYVDLMTSRGADVVWIGMPPVQNPQRQRGFTAMNRVVRRLAEVDDRLTYVPGDRILANPSGGWTAFLPGPGGGLLRVRRVDTTHLCAEGARRLADPVLDHLVDRWQVPLAPNWPSRNWRWVFPAVACPPART